MVGVIPDTAYLSDLLHCNATFLATLQSLCVLHLYFNSLIKMPRTWQQLAQTLITGTRDRPCTDGETVMPALGGTN